MAVGAHFPEQEAAGLGAPPVAMEIATFDEFKQFERSSLKTKDKHKLRDGGNGEPLGWPWQGAGANAAPWPWLS